MGSRLPPAGTPALPPRYGQRLVFPRERLGTPLAERAIGLLGIATMVGLAVLLSYDRKRIDWKLVASGLGLQLVFGLIVQSTVPVSGGAAEGTQMVAQTGAYFACNVLQTIIFFSALMRVLYCFGMMHFIVKALAFVMQKTLKTSGPEALMLKTLLASRPADARSTSGHVLSLALHGMVLTIAIVTGMR